MAAPHITKTLEASFGDCTLFSDRVVLVRLNEGIRLDADVGGRGIPELESFIGPGPYVAVVDGRRIGYVPQDGRHAVRESIGPDRIATGFIVNKEVSQMLAERFLTEAAPLDGAVFPSEEAALEWAHHRMTQATSPSD